MEKINKLRELIDVIDEIRDILDEKISLYACDLLETLYSPMELNSKGYIWDVDEIMVDTRKRIELALHDCEDKVYKNSLGIEDDEDYLPF